MRAYNTTMANKLTIWLNEEMIYEVDKVVWAYVLAFLVYPEKDKPPLDLCMYHANIYIPTLPPEINAHIGQHLYGGLEKWIDDSHIFNLLTMAESMLSRNVDYFMCQMNQMTHRCWGDEDNKILSPTLSTIITNIADSFFTDQINKLICMGLISKNLIDNKPLIKYILKRGYTFLFRYLPSDFQDDIELARIAIQGNGRLLRYVSPRLKNNTELVKLAVENFSMVLLFATPRMREDMSVMLHAIKYGFQTILCVGNALTWNRQFILSAVKINGRWLGLGGWRFEDDKEIVIEAVRNQPQALQDASLRLQNDPDLIKLANKPIVKD